MKHVSITIEGTTPLLCNAFTDEAAASATKGSRLATMGNKGTPMEQAEKKLYRDNDGKEMIPGQNMFRCLIDGGKFHKVGKSKMTTQKSSLLPACVQIEELTLPIQSKEGWTVDSRPVRNPSTGGRFLCYRPMFHDWKLNFTLAIDEDFITMSLVREVLDDSGKRIGLGDFRPDCKGMFGKFVVTNWKVMK